MDLEERARGSAEVSRSLGRKAPCVKACEGVFSERDAVCGVREVFRGYGNGGARGDGKKLCF